MRPKSTHGKQLYKYSSVSLASQLPSSERSSMRKSVREESSSSEVSKNTRSHSVQQIGMSQDGSQLPPSSERSSMSESGREESSSSSIRTRYTHVH